MRAKLNLLEAPSGTFQTRSILIHFFSKFCFSYFANASPRNHLHLVRNRDSDHNSSFQLSNHADSDSDSDVHIELCYYYYSSG